MFSVERLVKKNTKFEYRNTKKIEEKEKKTKKILDFKFEIRNTKLLKKFEILISKYETTREILNSNFEIRKRERKKKQENSKFESRNSKEKE
jgi:hypothetical protein